MGSDRQRDQPPTSAPAAHILWVHHMPLSGNAEAGALLGAMDHGARRFKADSIRTGGQGKRFGRGRGLAFTLDSVVIAKDSDGADTTAPVVVPAEPSSGEVTKPSGGCRPTQAGADCIDRGRVEQRTARPVSLSIAGGYPRRSCRHLA